MKKSKKTLLVCGISLIAVFVLLVGVTFAWFADSLFNNGNRIDAGTLKVDFLMDKEENGEYASIADGSGDIFSEANGTTVNWEPNKTEIVWLAVENKGTLAVDFSVVLNVTDLGLVGSLQYAVLDNAQAADAPADWTSITAEKGYLTAGENIVLQDARLLAAEPTVRYFGVAVHMDENAGNEYMGLGVEIDVSILAKQASVEDDGFNNPDYDADAEYDTIVNGKTVKVDLTAPEENGMYKNLADATDEALYIANADSLIAFADYVDDMPGASTMSARAAEEAQEFVMIADVDLSDVAWDGIYLAAGSNVVFNGNGHTIKNMTAITRADEFAVGNPTFAAAGFIKEAVSSTIVVRNVVFENAYVQTFLTGDNGENYQQTYAGVVIGHTSSCDITLNNITVTGSTVVNHWQSGGLVGYSSADLTFIDCHVSDTFVGGVNATSGTLFGLGIINVSVINCSAENVSLYTDGLTWNSIQKRTGTFWIGDNYQSSYPAMTCTVINSTEEGVSVVAEYPEGVTVIE